MKGFTMKKSLIILGVLCITWISSAQDTSLSCDPPCRKGYACQKGICVELCNPPCPIGLNCVNYDCIPIKQDISMKTHELSPQHSHVLGCVLGTAGVLVSIAAIIAGFANPATYTYQGPPNNTTYTQTDQGIQSANTAAIVGGSIGLAIFVPIAIVSYVRESKYKDYEASIRNHD
jgi:hypothetical protein